MHPFFSQKLVLHLLLLLHLWKIRKIDSFSCLEELPVLARNPEPPKTPLFCPRIASHVSDVHSYLQGKNLRSTAVLTSR